MKYQYYWLTPYKVRKTAKIMKRCNQVPHPTQDTTWESNKYRINTRAEVDGTPSQIPAF